MHTCTLYSEAKVSWLPPGIEPRTACIAHKRSATELRQPPGKQTFQFCIYTVKGYINGISVDQSENQWQSR